MSALARMAGAAVRAAIDGLHPRLLLQALPLLLLACAGVALLGWLGWEAAIDGARGLLQTTGLLQPVLDGLDARGLSRLRSVLAPLLVVALAQPLFVIAGLLLAARWLAPAAARHVVARRCPGLAGAAGHQGAVTRDDAAARRAGADGAPVRHPAWPWAPTALALLAPLASLPLWLWPPLGVMLPAVATGWLAARLLGPAVLAGWASPQEQAALLRMHRGPLLAVGLVSSALAAMPGLLWVWQPAALIFAPLLAVAAAAWTLAVYGHAALWAAHPLLPALQQWRAAAAPGPAVSVPMAAKPTCPPH